MTDLSSFPGDPDKPEIPTGPMLRELAGLGPARIWGDQLVADILACRAGTLRWDQLDPGALISGPPGTGKTTVARAIAASARVRFIATSYQDWTSKSGNDLIMAMMAVFARANANAPCIIFIDEIDSLPSRETNDHNSSYFATVNNALLKCLDRHNLKPGVIVIAACNHPDRLDPALKRSGRLDRHLQITLPRTKDLEEIIAFHLKGDARIIGHLGSLAVLCTGKSGADIEKIVRDARRIARKANRTVTRNDIISAIEDDAPKLSAADQQRVAWHEAGHGVAAYRLAVSTDISLSLLVKDGMAGLMRAAPSSVVMTERDILCRLVTLLAGRAAEERFCEFLSTGAANDIAQATDLAIRAYDELALRSVWHGPTARKGVPPGDDVITKARQLVEKAYELALELVDKNRTFVEFVADALVNRRALTHQDLAALDPGEPDHHKALQPQPPVRHLPQDPRRLQPPPLLPSPVHATWPPHSHAPHHEWQPPHPRDPFRGYGSPAHNDAHQPYGHPPGQHAGAEFDSHGIPRQRKPPIVIEPVRFKRQRATRDHDNDNQPARDHGFSEWIRDALARIKRRRK